MRGGRISLFSQRGEFDWDDWSFCASLILPFLIFLLLGRYVKVQGRVILGVLCSAVALRCISHEDQDVMLMAFSSVSDVWVFTSQVGEIDSYSIWNQFEWGFLGNDFWRNSGGLKVM